MGFLETNAAAVTYCKANHSTRRMYNDVTKRGQHGGPVLWHAEGVELDDWLRLRVFSNILSGPLVRFPPLPPLPPLPEARPG